MPNILLVSATHLEHHDHAIHEIPIHIVGVGKVNAALNTYKLIQKYKPNHVINFGSCGSLGDYKVGDVLPIGTVYDDFYGCVVPEHKPLTISESSYTLFTTDTFYDTTAVYSNSYMETIRKCDVVDMEGYSIVKVCKELNVKVSIYKWVSDDGNKLDWKQNAASGYNQFKKMMNEKYL